MYKAGQGGGKPRGRRARPLGSAGRSRALWSGGAKSCGSIAPFPSDAVCKQNFWLTHPAVCAVSFRGLLFLVNDEIHLSAVLTTNLSSLLRESQEISLHFVVCRWHSGKERPRAGSRARGWVLMNMGFPRILEFAFLLRAPSCSLRLASDEQPSI